MILPSKLFSYNESALSKMPIILENLDTPKTPASLLHLCRNNFKNTAELIDTLDCLYALRKIRLTQTGEIEKC